MKISDKMFLAMRFASKAAIHGGLVRTAAGWQDARKRAWDPHINFTTIIALRKRGWLDEGTDMHLYLTVCGYEQLASETRRRAGTVQMTEAKSRWVQA